MASLFLSLPWYVYASKERDFPFAAAPGLILTAMLLLLLLLLIPPSSPLLGRCLKIARSLADAWGGPALSLSLCAYVLREQPTMQWVREARRGGCMGLACLLARSGASSREGEMLQWTWAIRQRKKCVGLLLLVVLQLLLKAATLGC